MMSLDSRVRGRSRCDGLAHSREFMAAIMQQTHLMVMVLDRQGCICQFSHACEMASAYTKDEVQGHSLWDFLAYPNDIDFMKKTFAHLDELGFPNTCVFRWRRKDGSLLVVEWTGAVLDEEDKQVVLTGMDVTQRRSLSNALASSELRLRLMLNQMPASVWTTDRDLRILANVGSSLRKFGFVPGQIEGVSMLALAPPDDATVAQVRRAIAGEKSTQERDFFGTYYQIDAEPLYDDQGHIIGALAIALDITERKRIEAERDLLLVRQRDAYLEAERLNRVKDEFLLTLSHELRTPLQAILGWSELLRTGRLDAERTAKALETIDRNVRAEAQLVDDLLDISAIIAGKLRLALAIVDLEAVVESAMDSVRPALNAKDIELSYHVEKAKDAPSVYAVHGDERRLLQVVWNLLANAVKFTPKQGHIRVNLERQGSAIKLVVSDTGVGIDPDFMPHLFERFRQQDSSMTRAFGGLGLGLALSRHILETHGGSIRAESQGKGKGATFVVTLPIAATQTRVGRGRDDAVLQSLQKLPPHLLKGLRILVVDDEADARELMATALQFFQAQVLTATSATEALDAIESWHPDVLVADIGMPRVDGYGLIERVRRLDSEAGGDIPAIAVTAYASETDRKKAFMAGYQMHLPKPVETSVLATSVAMLAGRWRS